MIFVTVGNPRQGFRRLLAAVDALAGDGLFGHNRIFMQTGHTQDFHPRHCEYNPFLSMDEFEQWMERATLIICHGGCGTLLQTIRLGKVPVVMPRRRQFGEHVNDHQVQLVTALASEGRVIAVNESGDLRGAIGDATRRSAQAVAAPGSEMLALVTRAMKVHLRREEG